MSENIIKDDRFLKVSLEREETKKDNNKIENSVNMPEPLEENQNEFQNYEENVESYNYILGNIEKAEKHQCANRPLKKIKEEKDPERCPCCQLPLMKEGVLEPFKICDKPEDFSICGIGVSLYFTSIKFIIFILLFVSIFISSLNIFFSYKYIKELTKFCNIYIKVKNTTNQNYAEECKYYFTEEDGFFDYYSLADTFFFRFSSVNIKDYRDLYHKINSKNIKSFEHSIINISLVNFICFIAVFLFNLFFIFYLFNKTNSIDYFNHTPSDYSIFVSNLDGVQELFKKKPENIDQKKNKELSESTFNGELINKRQLSFVPDENMKKIEEFKDFIKNEFFKRFSNTNLKIFLCYKLKELTKLQKELEEKKEKLAKIKYDPKQTKKNEELKLEGDNRCYFETFLCCIKIEEITKIKKQKNDLQNKIEGIIEGIEKDTSNYLLDNFIGSAIITFEKIEHKKLVLKKAHTNFISSCIAFINDILSRISSYFKLGNYEEGKNINYYIRNFKYEAAPEPEDIIFQNLETLSFERVLKGLLFFIISIIICFVSLCIVAGLNRLQEILDKNDEYSIVLFIFSILIYFVLELIDFALEEILEILTKYERQISYTHFYLSYSIKLTISSFLNSALVPFLSEIIFTKSKRYEVLIGNLFFQFILNAIVTPILMTYNYCCLLKICKQRCKIKALMGNNGKIKDFTTQKELNELYELSDMNISSKYSYIAKTVLMSFFYIPIFPLGVIISLGGFCFFYWLEKYNFVNQYKRPRMINRQIAEFYNAFFIISIFVYALGDYIFLSDVYDKKTWSIVNISIFSSLIIIPYQQFLSIDYLKCKESEACSNFYKDYEIENPMTFKEGIKKLNERKKKTEEIDKRSNANTNFLNKLNYLSILSLYSKNKSDYGYIPIKDKDSIYSYGKSYVNFFLNHK